MQRQMRHNVLLAGVSEKLQHFHSTTGKGAGTLPTLQLLGSMEAAMAAAAATSAAEERIERVAAENAVVVFSVSTCCMCHVVKKLFCGMGVSPTVVELDEESECGADMEKALAEMVGERPPVPAVFVGGKLIGGLDRLMAAHISGSLIPQLKAAGALWL